VHYVQKDQDLLSPFYRENPSHDTEGGPYCGLIVKFTLKKSAYATMLIRELSKSSSSLEHQQKISLEYV
jgi:tRNA(Glu) U13 pseudouridine synthase TruD